MSSVALIVAVPAFMTQVVTGSPITSSGTFLITLAFANQSAGTFLAGPSSGAAAAPTFRALAAADIFGLVATSFSATPSFNASAFLEPTFTITLTGDVSSSSVINPTNGQKIAFIITQDGTGNHAWVWPANFKGTCNIGPDANSVTIQEFVYDGTNWRATSSGSINAT